MTNLKNCAWCKFKLKFWKYFWLECKINLLHSCRDSGNNIFIPLIVVHFHAVSVLLMVVYIFLYPLMKDFSLLSFNFGNRNGNRNEKSFPLSLHSRCYPSIGLKNGWMVIEACIHVKPCCLKICVKNISLEYYNLCNVDTKLSRLVKYWSIPPEWAHRFELDFSV